LICPYQQGVYGSWKAPLQMHMGIGYLASVARTVADSVEIVDMDADAVTVDELAAMVRDARYAIVGITVTTPTYDNALRCAVAIKRVSPDSLIVFGGIHATIRPEETLANDCVDVVVCGEGEVTFRELIEAVGSSGDFSGIRGIGYKRAGESIHNEARAVVEDLDSIPFPARDLFKNKTYTFPDALHAKAAPIMTSRGCPGRCTYCNARRIFTEKFRARSAMNVVDEIEMLVKSGIEEIQVWDDNFATDRKRVFAIRDEMHRRKLHVAVSFTSGIRADFLDREVLTALKEIGAYSIAIGVESGNQDVLNRCKKGTKLSTVRTAFALMKELKIETWAFFMFGLIGDTAETIQETIAFAKELDPDVAKFHILKPYAGSEVYDDLKAQGLLLTEDYSRYGIHTEPVHRLEGLTPDELIAWQDRAYRDFYFHPKGILKQLFRMRSLNRLAVNFSAGIGLLSMLFRHTNKSRQKKKAL